MYHRRNDVTIKIKKETTNILRNFFENIIVLQFLQRVTKLEQLLQPVLSIKGILSRSLY